MNPKKSGTIFIVLMIAFVAFGSGSIADALNLDGDAIVNLIPDNFTSINQQQITQIDDPSFKPVPLTTHVVENNTNSTPHNNSTNGTNQITG
ncbi:MAG: hypothetical protein HVN34_04785 [Methanobacteriaceae archaeon]|jgi:hypothetical protein|nr:hypothetical protein [Methanobacteriaceae archaeon]OPY24452.1 MAG: hypothetical protein A4E26_00355 [Methanobacterium sp. PtaU1.Bin097]